MARRLRDILDDSVQREIRPGVWVSARPLVGPLLWRLRDAWLVLTGKADAVTWPTPEDPSSWCAFSGEDRTSIAVPPEPIATPLLLRPEAATGLTPDEAQREKNRLMSERLDRLRKLPIRRIEQ